MRLMTLLRLLTLVALLALSGSPQAAAATIRYVELTGSASGNAACSSSAPCRTIAHAVAIADAGDTIKIGKGKFYETNGVTIDKKLTIAGSGIFGTQVLTPAWGASRVFTIAATGDAMLTDLQIQRGKAELGGGVRNFGTLKLEEVWVRQNEASSGGGIYNNGFLTMTRGEIALNKGGGLENSTSGLAILSHVNVAANWGPAIMTLGPLFVHNTTVGANKGRGVIVRLGAGALVRNTTISGNDDFGLAAQEEANVTLVHVTIAANAYGLVGNTGARIDLRNTIVAGNVNKRDCGQSDDAFLVAVGSLLGEASCHNQWPVESNIFLGNKGEPKLAGLAWNGGLTSTHALPPGSPAIDAALSEHCLPADQRGVPRPLDGDGDGSAKCDVGAYERSPSGGGRGGGGRG